ncbi:hypothetical protein WMY93_025603 [Mugilogobius chulae]|uniref:Uncharacterized protein n=1 Tax=Mugilogobius chulae TaxID=88201 RepID=A0AAW0N1U3_9GOBI
MADDSCPNKANKDRFRLNKANDRHNQVKGHKAFNMSTLVRTMHRMVEKSCQRACQLLCCSIDNLLCDRLAICPGNKEQGQTEELHAAAAAAIPAWNSPSTIMIKKQPLMQGTIQELHDTSCSPPSIQITRSHLNCVIIGDNNYMQVEQSVPTEEDTEDNI